MSKYKDINYSVIGLQIKNKLAEIFALQQEIVLLEQKKYIISDKLPQDDELHFWCYDKYLLTLDASANLYQITGDKHIFPFAQKYNCYVIKNLIVFNIPNRNGFYYDNYFFDNTVKLKNNRIFLNTEFTPCVTYRKKINSDFIDFKLSNPEKFYETIINYEKTLQETKIFYNFASKILFDDIEKEELKDFFIKYEKNDRILHYILPYLYINKQSNIFKKYITTAIDNNIKLNGVVLKELLEKDINKLENVTARQNVIKINDFAWILKNINELNAALSHCLLNNLIKSKEYDKKDIKKVKI